MKKISAIITLLLLGGLILGLTVADFIKQDSIYSSYENRMLAKRPAFSLESLFAGSYTTDYETYITDQFVGRDGWARTSEMQESKSCALPLGYIPLNFKHNITKFFVCQEKSRRLVRLFKVLVIFYKLSFFNS